jgi:ABC-type cobalamin transport system permease subunit
METFLCRSLVVVTYFSSSMPKWNLGKDMWGSLGGVEFKEKKLMLGIPLY